MTIYAALLRGINVGGNNKIKMADLRKLLEETGLRRVQTYIQSGNVVFEADESTPESLERQIEEGIRQAFGMSISVLVRTGEEFKRIVEESPFQAETLGEGDSIHINLLTVAPAQEVLEKLPDLPLGDDEYRLIGRELYMLLRQSILESNVPKKFQKLLPQTSRNLKTMVKLYEMVRAME
ncbi:DUF1697 domain-containing protein [Tumebacillus flagellatus]|uniref:Cytoplasmic protein n=1 Tax=Tumebacillus flagellatus TaxID=1157490 RepID=A0A074LPQ3_9BACL|nr:DUF1697 domain-containing protein [Tumebacillus flagellatus]KEO81838.1 hypothetical protein EL26_18535 [Tumebacillus flagellatus]